MKYNSVTQIGSKTRYKNAAVIHPNQLVSGLMCATGVGCARAVAAAAAVAVVATVAGAFGCTVELNTNGAAAGVRNSA